ncbi:phasin family protein [Bradyrhizobium valentinum]|uniref:phasin family protein n=1 Tax=Bradyrhizobium valentinum TaxID=1518501 RepID=UPI0007C75071|nr:phasin family protein [Bradyrhizobium valentinum]
MSDANMNVDVNNNPPNPKAAGPHEKRGFDTPFFAAPGIFDGLAEQNLIRAQQNIEKMKMASAAINDALREAYSANAKGAADYAAKVIEFSGANTSSALDFLTDLVSTKLPSEILQLAAAQGCKNFQATAAQSRELWVLTRKVASETADPIKKSFASVLQKAA